MMGVLGWMTEAGVKLRSAVGDEFRAEAEADERAAGILRLRRRTLIDVAVELMHCGDLVSARFADTVTTITIVHTAAALVTLVVGGARRVHINLDAGVVLSTTDGPGRKGRGLNPTEPESFLALLRSTEMVGRPVGFDTRRPGPAASPERSVPYPGITCS